MPGRLIADEFAFSVAPEGWNITALAMRRLLEEHFPTTHVRVETRGNVLVVISFLLGVGRTELRPAELE